VASFGEHLRRERERQKMTLEDVSLATKVGTRFLRALEEERLDQLPGGVFNKGFIRAYAHHLGLDENEVVGEYLAALEQQAAAGLLPPSRGSARTEPIPEVRAATPESRSEDRVEVRQQVRTASRKERRKEKEKKDGRQNSPKLADLEPESRARHVLPEILAVSEEPPPHHADLIPWGKMAFVLLAVAFGLALWGSFSRQPWEAHKHRTEKAAPESQSKAAPPANAPTPAPAAPTAIASGSTPAASSGSPVPVTTAVDTPTQPAPIDAAAPSTPAVAAPFTVVIQAREDSWVQITVDGKEIMHDMLSASSHKALAAQKEVVVRAGNVGGLEFSFNGRQLPAQGELDEVKTLTFGADGLQSPLSKKPAEVQAAKPQA